MCVSSICMFENSWERKQSLVCQQAAAYMKIVSEKLIEIVFTSLHM